MSIINQTLCFFNLVADNKPTTDALKNVHKDASVLANLSLSDFINKVAELAVDFAIKLAIAIVVFYIGKFIINKIYKIVKAIMVKRNVELSLATFILSLLKIALLFLLIVIVIGILGIETSSFIAIFASAGVAIGMALSGTLQNFAGGVLILLIKPYKVGDYIEVQGFGGTVKEIQIFYTILNTIDNKSIIIPNGSLSTGTINNYSKEEYRRVDWTVGISYGDDVDVAKNLVRKLISDDVRIIQTASTESQNEEEEEEDTNVETISMEQDTSDKRNLLARMFKKRPKVSIISPSIPDVKLHHKKVNREPFVGLSQLADSSINIVIRAWTKSEYYWPVYFEMNEKIYKEFPKAGLNFPFPQMDVHITK